MYVRLLLPAPRSACESSGGGETQGSGGGVVGVFTPPLDSEVKQAIATYCSLDCDAMVGLAACTDFWGGGPASEKEICMDDCVDINRQVPRPCAQHLRTHFECMNQSPAYFDAHCEGDTLVREDMNPCPAELSAAMECYSEN